MTVQTTFRNVEPSEALEALVEEEAHKLERFFERIVSCRVLIEHAHRRRGAEFGVHIDIGVPGDELVINHTPDLHRDFKEDPGDEVPRISKSADVDAAHKDARLAIRDAFRKASRRLQDYARHKQHE
ncbi:MAG TPA: HPF/RaiA family ribosome-associated protein [Candidatus Tyrphobacter sp.]